MFPACPSVVLSTAMVAVAVLGINTLHPGHHAVFCPVLLGTNFIQMAIAQLIGGGAALSGSFVLCALVCFGVTAVLVTRRRKAIARAYALVAESKNEYDRLWQWHVKNESAQIDRLAELWGGM